jgi:hypothetical protein
MFKKKFKKYQKVNFNKFSPPGGGGPPPGGPLHIVFRG